MNIKPLKIRNKVMKPHKALLNPDLTARNVLTYSHWDFVELWLKRNEKDEALFYWEQAKVFNQAANGLPNQSAPLLHYYSFMNAVKALLSSRNINFKQHHGVARGENAAQIDNLSDIKVKIKNEGILPSFSKYIDGTSHEGVYNIKNLFSGLPYIHRTYCLTYDVTDDIFIPLIDAEFVLNESDNSLFFTAILSKDFRFDTVFDLLPPAFELFEREKYKIKSVESLLDFNENQSSNMPLLTEFHQKIRRDLYYINGAETLWYLKRKNNQSEHTSVSISPLVITLAAMHRLSELCRYDPLKLRQLLNEKENWIIAEFIQQSPSQFIDAISSEITGHQFLIPNVRSAS